MKGFQVLHFQPFDPVHKRTEATVKSGDGKQFFVAKGARRPFWRFRKMQTM